MKLRPTIIRWLFLGYWLAFVWLAINGGIYPGLVADPADWPYPFTSVIIIASLVGIALLVLYAILAPASPTRSLRRLGVAIAYMASLATVAFFMFVTDMPGHFYVPHAFAFLTLLLLLIWSGAMGVGALWRRVRA
jgi:hypothetical protein